MTTPELRLSLALIAPCFPDVPRSKARFRKDLWPIVLSFLGPPTAALIKELSISLYSVPDEFELEVTFLNDPACYFVPARVENEARKRHRAARLKENPSLEGVPLQLVNESKMLMEFTAEIYGVGDDRWLPESWRSRFVDNWVEEAFNEHAEEFWERYWDEWLLKKYQALW